MTRLIGPLALIAALAALINVIALTSPGHNTPERDATVRAGLCLSSGVGCGGR